MRNLQELNIQHNFTIEELFLIQQQLFIKNNLTQGICYLQITRGSASSRIASCPKNLTPTIVATVTEIKTMPESRFNEGFKVITSPDIRWLRCDIKTVNLLASTLINQKAKDLGFDDAIFVRENIITEATFANVFLLNRQNQLITHPANNHILCGITRNRIIKIAKEQNFEVIERNFDYQELISAKEVFLTSSSLLIRPVYQIDHIIFNQDKNFNVAKLLTQQYNIFIDSHFS
jgi:D-alanine transaminase